MVAMAAGMLGVGGEWPSMMEQRGEVETLKKMWPGE